MFENYEAQLEDATIKRQKEIIVELETRIDKAIEFIYENAYSEDRKELVDELWYEIPELVAILKGSDEKWYL